MKLAQDTLKGLMLECPLATAQNPQGVCLDKGYYFDELRQVVAGLGFTANLRSRGEEQRDIREPGYRARRWWSSAHMVG